MPINLNIKKSEYIDNQGLELLKLLIVEKIIVNNNNSDYQIPPHLKHKKVLDLSDKAVGPVDQTTEDWNKKPSERFRYFNGEKAGFDKKGFGEILKLVQTILKEDGFGQVVSEVFLIDQIFEWSVKHHFEPAFSLLLSDYLVKESNKNIKFYNIYIPILYLESDVNFVVGHVYFSYLTEQYIEKQALKISPELREGFKLILGDIQGQLFARCCVGAEKLKAIEIATNQAIISVDILRLLSPTIEFPELPIYYDVDLRNMHQIESKVLIQPLNEEHNISFNRNRKAHPFEISQAIWDEINKIGLIHIHKFILKTMDNRTELERLIYNAISNFSKAISTLDLHERVIQLFTVLESLLLPNDNSPIVDSVTKYLPKLIAINLEDRKLIIKTVKEMYKIRSSMIHHAKKNDFKISDLRIIQVCCRTLIMKMIDLSYTKKNKVEILNEIDELIISA